MASHPCLGQYYTTKYSIRPDEKKISSSAFTSTNTMNYISGSLCHQQDNTLTSTKRLLCSHVLSPIFLQQTHTHAAEITKITQYSYKSTTITLKRTNAKYYTKMSAKTCNIRHKVITQCTILRINWINWVYTGTSPVYSYAILSYPQAIPPLPPNVRMT